MVKLRYLRFLLENLSENTGLPLTAAKDSSYNPQCFVPKALMVIPRTGNKESVRDAFVRTIHEGMGMEDMDHVFKERDPGVVRVVALETLLARFPDDVEIDNMVNKPKFVYQTRAK
jgi:hypothetical protein